MSAQRLNDTNLFAYCGNNPVTNYDPVGTFWWAVACTVVGAIIGAGMQVATNIATGQAWNTGIFGAAVGGATYGFIASTTGNLVTAAYASAAAESVTNEMLSYTSLASANGENQKRLTAENLSNSITNILQNTILNGTMIYAAGKVAGKVVKTNSGWIKPTKFVSSFFGKYARKATAQAAVQSAIYAVRNVTRYYAQRLVA